jgi:hypothetical protein
VIAMLLIVSGALPVFASVVDWSSLVVPTRCDPNVIVVGVSVTVGEAAVPLPVSVMLCGLPAASSVTFTVAVRVPAADGVKMTEIVQLASTASVLGDNAQVFVCA